MTDDLFPETRYWLGVVSAQHVRRGVAGGFMQVCHGKAMPLRRMRRGDGVVYYSPTEIRGRKDGFQCFTAIGRVRAEEVYAFDMGEGFVPFRRDIDWQVMRDVPLSDVKDQLDLTRDPNWGYALRLGCLPLSAHDFAVIERYAQQGAYNVEHMIG